MRKYRSFRQPLVRHAATLCHCRDGNNLMSAFGRKLPIFRFEAELFYNLRVTSEMETRGGPESSAVRQVILIVEDEALVRLGAADFLRRGGYSVQEAANAAHAMESLQSKFVVDLLFTDINLGKGMNGIELALWALANLPRIRFW